MKCEKCGEMNAEGAELCAQCGAAFGVPEAPTLLPLTAGPARRGRPVRTGILVVLFLALFAGGVSAYQYWFGVPVLESLIPAEAVGYGCSDARWLWDNTADVRVEPKVAKGIAEVEKQLGISFDKDIVPWAGNAAVAVLDVQQDQFNAAVYIQVKDQRRFQDTVQRFRTLAEKQSGTTWASASYKGVPIRTTNLQLGMNAPLKVASFWTKGWIVIALGDTATNRVIDTWQKTTPSLAMDAKWAKALDHLPATRISWFGVDTGALRRMHTVATAQLSMLARTDAISVGSVSSTQTGFHLDSYAMPTSPEAVASMRELASKMKPLAGDLYARLPDGTFATFMISGSPAITDYYKQTFLDSFATTEQRNAMQHGISEFDGIESALHRIKGDTGAAAAWQAGKGFGVTLIADMGDSASAITASNELAAFIVKKGAKVNRGADGRCSVDTPPTHEPKFQLAPVWETSGRYLTLATHPMWLKPGTTANRLQMPAEAKGASGVCQGDFRPMTAIAADFTQPAPARERKMINGIVQDTRLSPARWASWSSFSADGSTRGAAYISDWQWHEAMKAIIKRIDDEMP